VRVGNEVLRDDLVARVGENALEGTFACALNGLADLLISGRSLELCGQVDDGNVSRGNAEAHAGHLALERGDDLADSLGSAGGGGDDVVVDRTARAPVAAAAPVDRFLLGGGGVDGGHERALNAERIVDDLGERGEAVGGAGGVGNDLHVGAQQLVVDAHDERGGLLVLGGRGQDDLLRAAGKVRGGLFGGAVNAGGLDDVLSAVVRPLDLGGVGLAEDVDLVTVQDQVFAVVLDRAVELAEHGVVLDEIDHVVEVRFAQVDAADIKLFGVLGHDAKHDTTDAAEAVDAHFDSHNDNPPQNCVRNFSGAMRTPASQIYYNMKDFFVFPFPGKR